MNRAFFKDATNFSLDKSVNFEGSYDDPKAAKFLFQLTRKICPEPPYLEFMIISVLFCSFVTSSNKKNVKDMTHGY